MPKKNPRSLSSRRIATTESPSNQGIVPKPTTLIGINQFQHRQPKLPKVLRPKTPPSKAGTPQADSEPHMQTRAISAGAPPNPGAGNLTNPSSWDRVP